MDETLAGGAITSTTPPPQWRALSSSGGPAADGERRQGRERVGGGTLKVSRTWDEQFHNRSGRFDATVERHAQLRRRGGGSDDDDSDGDGGDGCGVIRAHGFAAASTRATMAAMTTHARA